MINLMYIVLTAMLALNVSSDVLDGFNKVHRGVTKNTSITENRNNIIRQQLLDLSLRNEEKAGEAFRKALHVGTVADSLCNVIDSLKILIAREADGRQGDPNNLQAAEDLDAAAIVMLNPLKSHGATLRSGIDSYAALVKDLLKTDTVKAFEMSTLLATSENGSNGFSATSWEREKFDNQPAIAAVTLLSQLQNDIRVAEGETIRHLLNEVDANDMRVNSMQAFVVPATTNVMRGGEFTAQVFLAALDTTDRPRITVNGTSLPPNDNYIKLKAEGNGTASYEGTVQLQNIDGTLSSFPFEGTYNILEPMATVSSSLTNVLYAGIVNPVTITVPGIPLSDISATSTGGSIKRNGSHWDLVPSSPGRNMEINIDANLGGKSTRVASVSMRVRRLPDPASFIPYKGEDGELKKFTGGRPFSKTLLASAPALSASIDDGILNIPFNVESFELVYFDSMGNAMIEKSDGASFSQRQHKAIRRMPRGKRVYLTKIRTTGPDGLSRDLPPMEIILN